MVRRSLRARFRRVAWDPVGDTALPPGPLIFAANHHTWFDGYLMYALIRRLRVRCVDWIAEFDAFPLFARIGGMPFSADRSDVRAGTIRRTIRLMREEGRSLVIFPEAHLHPGPEVWPFGRALETVRRAVPAAVVPVALVTTFDLHERPEAWLRLGQPIPPGDPACPRDRLVDTLERLRLDVATDREAFAELHPGTPDVNERWGLNRRRR